MQELLQQAGYLVPEPLARGEDAVDYLRRSPHPDLILMDISLGRELDGIETTRQIRTFTDIPFIYITGHLGTGTVPDKKCPVFCSVIGKPFTGTEMLSAVGNVLDRI